jgi:hypothetical protein
MIWAILVLVALLGGRWLWWNGKQPIRYRTRLEEILARHVPNLLREAPFSEFFIAQRANGPGFLQLAVTEANGDWRTVQFGLPDADWAREDFDAVDRVLRASSFIPTIETGTSDRVPRFLRLSLTGPIDALVPQVEKVLSLVARTLKWDPATEYVLTYNHSDAA